MVVANAEPLQRTWAREAGVEFPRAAWQMALPAEQVRRFAEIVEQAGYSSPIRRPRGRDILAACGQLKSESEKVRASARRKLAAVTRLLRGEPLETVARELDVTVARLSEWRDRALVAAEAAMKERERDSRDG